MVSKIIFLLFYVKEKNSFKLNNNKILPSNKYLLNKNIGRIILAQKHATENVFNKKNSFRSFEIYNRDENFGRDFHFFYFGNNSIEER